MDDDFVLFYCSRCWSSNIKRGKRIPNTDSNYLYCGDCNAGAKHIDVTTYGRWVELHIEKTGKEPFPPSPTPYDDLEDAYMEDAVDTMTAEEALTNGMNVGDYINRRLEK